MKKLTALLMAIVMAVTVFAVPTSAAKVQTVWDGSVDTSWYTGDKDQYDISTPAQLAGLSKLVNEGNSMKGIMFNLTNDLQMNDTTGWEDWKDNPPKNVFTPIGKAISTVSHRSFSGFFNGNGNTIRGLYVNSPTTAGLFGYIYGGAVAGVIIRESVIIGYDNTKHVGVFTGGITGTAEGAVINQCDVNAKIYSIGKSAAYGMRAVYAGGIVGSMHTENISAVAVELMLASFGFMVNPILLSDGSGGTIKESGIYNCISNSFITVSSGFEQYLGGVVGWGNNGYVENCLVLSGWSASKGTKHGQICGGVYACYTDNCYYYWGSSKKPRGIGENLGTSVLGKPVDNSKRLTENEINSDKTAELLGDAFIRDTDISATPFLACQVIADPTETKVQLSDGKANITWTAEDNAESYIIYRKGTDGKYRKLTTATEASLTLSDLKNGEKYDLLIKAVYEDGSKDTIIDGKFSFTAISSKKDQASTSSATTSSAKPKVSVKSGKATVTWSKVADASTYIIYVQQANGKYKKLTETSKTKIVVGGIKSGKTYNYLIKVKYADGTTKTIPGGKFTFKG